MPSNNIHWRILTIGNLTRNRFWGESEERALRPVLCTSTLVRTDKGTLLIDPSQEPQEMAATLDRRAGIRPCDIDSIFITHHHGDHRTGLSGFPNARLLIPTGELEAAAIPSAQAVRDGDEILPGVRVVALPGHTDGLCGVAFEAAEGTVIVAGDAVMTREFFRARAGYFNSVDLDACAQSHEKIAAMADIVVPGHDNFFLTRA